MDHPSREIAAARATRFGGVERLLGRGALARLGAARVAVIGLGGVGSWAVEGLARSGVGALTLVDLDDICLTNTNRQLPALEGNYGRPKADVLAERARLISPGIAVETVADYVTAENAETILASGFDFVVEAVDRRSHKCAVIVAARSHGIPVLTVGSAGGRRDGTAIRVSDLAASESDEMLRQVRKKLRQSFGFPRGAGGQFGVPCVWSAEAPVYPWTDGRVCAQPEPGSPLRLDCASGFGTAVWVTAAMGLAAAGEVVRRLAAL